MFLHLFILVRQELLALSNLPHLLYQLDKGAAVLDKSFRHLVWFVIDAFDINFGCRSSHASQPHAGWDVLQIRRPAEANQFELIQMIIERDEGSRCFWVENQYLQNRLSSESNTNHFSYNLQRNLQHSLNLVRIESYSNRIAWGIIRWLDMLMTWRTVSTMQTVGHVTNFEQGHDYWMKGEIHQVQLTEQVKWHVDHSPYQT